jgi:hypothetical protein
MAINKPNVIKYTSIFFHCKTLQNLPKSGFLVWKYTIWQPWWSNPTPAKWSWRIDVKIIFGGNSDNWHQDVGTVFALCIETADFRTPIASGACPSRWSVLVEATLLVIVPGRGTGFESGVKSSRWNHRDRGRGRHRIVHQRSSPWSRTRVLSCEQKTHQ